MYKYTFIILCVLCSSLLHAQTTLPEFGEPDLQELLMKECPFEKDAAAMYLYNIQSAKLGAGYNFPDVVTERRVRIKIFNEKGFGEAEIKIPWYKRRRRTKVTDVEAWIYNLDANGKPTATQVSKENIFSQKAKAEYGEAAISFTFPGLKAGSVIEYRYKKAQNYYSNIASWRFQLSIPCAYSLCKVIVPNIVELSYRPVVTRAISIDSVADNKKIKKDNSQTNFLMTDVPSFISEPLMTSTFDNLQRIEFSLLPKAYFLSGSTADVKWLRYNIMLLASPYFGEQINTTVKGTDSLVNAAREMITTKEKIQLITNMVKQRIEWNEEQTFEADDIQLCWDKKKGSSAEMNLLLLNLLRSAGVSAMPILVSTRGNGRPDKNFVSLGQFNGVDVLAMDSNDVYILDATQKNLSYKITPLNVIYTDAFIVDESHSKWIAISDPRQLMNNSVFVRCMMDAGGNVKGEADIYYKDYAKAEKLEDEEKKENTGSKRESKDMINENTPDLVVDSLEKHFDKEPDLPLLHKLYFHFETESTENIYFLNPFFFSMFRKNPFADNTRRTDIDFGCSQVYMTNVNILLDDIMILEEMPASTTIRMADTSIVFIRETSRNGQSITISYKFEIRYPQFSKNDYPGIKDFFERIYMLLNEELVIKRKE